MPATRNRQRPPRSAPPQRRPEPAPAAPGSLGGGQLIAALLGVTLVASVAAALIGAVFGPDAPAPDTAAVDELQASVSALEDLRDDVKGMRAEVTGLSARLGVSEQQLAALRRKPNDETFARTEDVDGLGRDVSELKSRSTALQERLRVLGTRLDAVERDLARPGASVGRPGRNAPRGDDDGGNIPGGNGGNVSPPANPVNPGEDPGANPVPPAPPPTQRSTNPMVNRLANELDLSGDQTRAVEGIMKNAQTKARELLQRMMSGDAGAMSELGGLQEQVTGDIKKELNDEQKQKFDKMLEDGFGIPGLGGRRGGGGRGFYY